MTTYKIALNLGYGATIHTDDNMPQKMLYGVDTRGFIYVTDKKHDGKTVCINTAHIVAILEGDDEESEQ